MDSVDRAAWRGVRHEQPVRSFLQPCGPVLHDGQNLGRNRLIRRQADAPRLVFSVGRRRRYAGHQAILRRLERGRRLRFPGAESSSARPAVRAATRAAKGTKRQRRSARTPPPRSSRFRAASARERMLLPPVTPANPRYPATSFCGSFSRHLSSLHLHRNLRVIRLPRPAAVRSRVRNVCPTHLPAS